MAKEKLKEVGKPDENALLVEAESGKSQKRQIADMLHRPEFLAHVGQKPFYKDIHGNEPNINDALGYQDLIHYQKTVAALSETAKIQSQIDEVIGKWPIL